MKILVAVAKYTTPDTSVYQSFVRQRNIFYNEKGIDVSVLNFFAKEEYILDNIPVYPLKTYEDKLVNEKFDLLICHAANIRNHYFFLKKYEKKFPKIVFIFHGHEVLKSNKVYSPPYPYLKQASFLGKLSQNVYDSLKLKMWHNYYKNLAPKSYFLFVSHWMYDQFIQWTRISPDVIKDRYSITYNSIGHSFEVSTYDSKKEKKYDFITIRGDLDGSKYCVDLVNQIANDNPKYKFLIIGKGVIFNYIKKAENIEWLDRQLSHSEILEYLNQARCALMPTRTDAQGLMMCEMASFGIPVITSDISVCKEVFDSFDNVRFINNEQNLIILDEIFEELIKGVPYEQNNKFFSDHTMSKELNLFEKLINNNK